MGVIFILSSSRKNYGTILSTTSREFMNRGNPGQLQVVVNDFVKWYFDILKELVFSFHS